MPASKATIEKVGTILVEELGAANATRVVTRLNQEVHENRSFTLTMRALLQWFSDYWDRRARE